MIFPPEEGAKGLLERLIACSLTITQWTTSGMLRNPEFVAIRDDKDPTEVPRFFPLRFLPVKFFFSANPDCCNHA